MPHLIYVADDEEMLLQLAESVLRSAGYEVRIFQTPEDALAAMRTADPKPVLLLTDYAMHTLNGLELIEKSKVSIPGLKTILVSGTVERTVMDGAKVQADEFLAKPYRARNLLDAVARLLPQPA